MPSSAQQGINFIPKHPDQVVSVQLAVGFHVPDGRLDCASPFELSFHLGRHASFSAGDKNLRVLNAMSPVSPVNITPFYSLAGYLTDLLQRLGQCVSIIGVAMLGKHADHKVIMVGRGHTDLAPKLIFPWPYIQPLVHADCTACFLSYVPGPVTFQFWQVHQ